MESIMKLSEINLPTKKDKKNYTTLIVNLQSFTYFEFKKIYPLIDDKIYLYQQVRDWYPIHYAALNSDHRILESIINLYKKYNISLDVLTQSNKNNIPEGSNALDISYIKENFSNIITLYKYNVLPEYSFKKGIIGLISRSEDIKNNDIVTYMNLPYKNNIITPILYYNYDCNYLLKEFFSIDFEEKELFIEQFKINLDYLYDTAFKLQDNKIIDALNRKLEYIGERYKEQQQRNHIIDILFIPFYKSFDHLMQFNVADISNMINSKQNIKAFEYSSFRPLYEFLNVKSLMNVLPFLDSHQFNIFSNKFIQYYNKLKPIFVNLDKQKGIEFFDSLYPIVFSATLNSSLEHKPQPNSRGKI